MHHLFGPIDRTFADQILADSRKANVCQAFGSAADLELFDCTEWSQVETHLPADWRPEFIALWLSYREIPNWVWSAPVPILGLAPDWNLLWHEYRSLIPRLELVLTDEAGVEAMRREGFTNVRYANLFGLEREYLDEPWEECERDIDVLFVGNLNAAVQRERQAWLGRLTELGERWNIRIATGVFGREYRDLLRRSRVVFNRSIRGECNKRAFEAPACGALLFQEAENREVPRWLKPGEEYVIYSTETLTTTLEEHLADEPRRRAIAEAGRDRVQSYVFDALWTSTVAELRDEWPKLRERAAARVAKPTDPPTALSLPDSFNRLAQLEENARAGRVEESLALARRVLPEIDRASSWLRAACDLQPWPQFDLTRVEWERAAWANAGDRDGEATAKALVLGWRLHLELGQLTGDVAHHYEAVLARPDLPTSRAALGCALARNGRLAEAVPHLREACMANPFDLAAARAFGQALHDTGQAEEHGAVVHQRRLLHKVAPTLVPAEGWFAVPASADGLASIIILCCNEVEATRVCLESVRRHTGRPYELILVDNGSSDETPALLDAVRVWDSPLRIEVIRNAENRGYPAGVNQGLGAARGAWLVLLNNDTAVTPHWLDDLIEVAVADGGAGLVGPMSNYAPAPQVLPAGYESLDRLDEFADRRRDESRGKYLEFERLTGFCLLLSREALARIGGLDEQFGAGFFDDDDLCVRARRAGFQLRVALGVYIHHEGSRTFRARGIDASALLEENLGKFRDKWGEAAAAPYRAPTSSPAPGVSLTMIVKDEEANLADCINSVRDLVSEVVVLDTGSTDRTREIARSLGARVFEFAWVDDFAAARNEALRHATHRWVFWMDADDRLDEANRAKLRELVAGLPDANVAYSMKCRCAGEGEVVVDHVRLFRNDPNHRWRFRVHEQILPSLRETGAELRFAPVEVLHVGYVDPALRGRKLQRDLRLLLMEQAERPDHPFTLFNLGSVYRELQQPAEALPYLQKSLALSQPQDSIVRKLHSLIAQCQRELRRPADAVKACVEGRKDYPDDPELLFVEARSRLADGDVPGAESCLRRLIDGREDGDHFASVSPALRGHLGRHELASLLFTYGRLPEAEAQWRIALTEQPDFAPALYGLGELYLKATNWTALERVAVDLGACTEAEILRGRGKLARKEFAAARWTLSQAAEKYPRALAPRLFLTHALLQEGKDWAAAERALRDVLAIDPENAQARQNLDVLLAQQRSA